MKKLTPQAYGFACPICCGIVLLGLVGLPVWRIAILNWIGPSTEYHNPVIATAERGPDGRNYVYLGEEFYVRMFIVRHEINGNCHFKIRRYAEALGGSNAGKPILISVAELQFLGRNDMYTVRWPSPPDKYILGYGVDDNNEYVFEKPLLVEGEDEIEFVFYVKGRYYCNFLDYVIPRYIQGGPRQDETAHVRAVVKRKRP
jgi:hypothetical protein